MAKRKMKEMSENSTYARKRRFLWRESERLGYRPWGFQYASPKPWQGRR